MRVNFKVTDATRAILSENKGADAGFDDNLQALRQRKDQRCRSHEDDNENSGRQTYGVRMPLM